MKYYQTQRLTVRQFKESDAAHLLDYLATPTVHCFAGDKVATIEEAEADARKKQNDTSQFAVCLKDDDTLIGHLFAMPEDDTYSVGWNFNPKYQGKGFAAEAAEGLLAYLFKQKNARRVYCYVEEDNLPSQKLCKRLAMRQEGLFVEFISFVNDVHGKPVYENTLQFALLKHEWQSR